MELSSSYSLNNLREIKRTASCDPLDKLPGGKHAFHVNFKAKDSIGANFKHGSSHKFTLWLGDRSKKQSLKGKTQSWKPSRTNREELPEHSPIVGLTQTSRLKKRISPSPSNRRRVFENHSARHSVQKSYGGESDVRNDSSNRCTPFYSGTTSERNSMDLTDEKPFIRTTRPKLYSKLQKQLMRSDDENFMKKVRSILDDKKTQGLVQLALNEYITERERLQMTKKPSYDKAGLIMKTLFKFGEIDSFNMEHFRILIQDIDSCIFGASDILSDVPELEQQVQKYHQEEEKEGNLIVYDRVPYFDIVNACKHLETGKHLASKYDNIRLKKQLDDLKGRLSQENFYAPNDQILSSRIEVTVSNPASSLRSAQTLQSYMSEGVIPEDAQGSEEDSDSKTSDRQTRLDKVRSLEPNMITAVTWNTETEQNGNQAMAEDVVTQMASSEDQKPTTPCENEKQEIESLKKTVEELEDLNRSLSFRAIAGREDLTPRPNLRDLCFKIGIELSNSRLTTSKQLLELIRWKFEELLRELKSARQELANKKTLRFMSPEVTRLDNHSFTKYRATSASVKCIGRKYGQ